MSRAYCLLLLLAVTGCTQRINFADRSPTHYKSPQKKTLHGDEYFKQVREQNRLKKEARLEEKRKEFEQAKIKAEEGDMRSKWLLGEAYTRGEVTEKNIPLAIELFEEGVEEDYPPALYSLAKLKCSSYGPYRPYATGYDLKQDCKEALELHKRAAAQNYQFSTTEVGDIYYYGLAGKKDTAEAMKWWKQAAELGEESARFRVGLQEGTVKLPAGPSNRPLTTAQRDQKILEFMAAGVVKMYEFCMKNKEKCRDTSTYKGKSSESESAELRRKREERDSNYDDLRDMMNKDGWHNPDLY